METPIFQILGAIITAGVTVGAVLFGIGQFVQGRASAKSSSIKDELNANQLFKDDIAAMSKRISEQDDSIDALTLEIQNLKRMVEEKDKKLIDTLAILQGQNPDMKKVFEEIRVYIAANTPLLEEVRKEVIPIVYKMDKFLEKQQL